MSSPPITSRTNELWLSDQSEESSDEENTETVAAPSTTHFIGTLPQTLRSPLSYLPSHESMTTEKAQTCSDPTASNANTQWTPAGISTKMNPFKQLHLQQLQQQFSERNEDCTSTDSCSHEVSPGINGSPSVSSPVDIRAFLAHESNRLDTFKRHDRTTFAQVEVAYLAYVGFYLNGEGTNLLCPWCDVSISEQQYESIIKIRPSVARSTLSDEPWTPMRVHRHANGVMMDQNHAWCTWVRREAGGLYPNVTMV